MNIGVCGVGTIASWISSILNQLNDPKIRLYGCADVDKERAGAFREKFGYEVAYGSIEELMSDPKVDVCYIAVPNNFHYDLCMKAIAHHKNVICEKPFAVNAKECREILDAAEKEGVFITEALWPVFLPSHQWINEEIARGTIGDIVSGKIVMLDFVMFLERVKKLETGGGSLLDGGPYTLGCLVSHFGTDIEDIHADVRKLETGVDAEDCITVTYAGGVKVEIRQTIDMPHEKHEEYFEITGTKGRIWADCVSNPRRVEVYDAENHLIASPELPKQIKNQGMPPVSGYEYEFQAYEKAISSGKKEMNEISHAMTQKIADIMTEVRAQAGIVFPFEK